MPHGYDEDAVVVPPRTDAEQLRIMYDRFRDASDKYRQLTQSQLANSCVCRMDTIIQALQLRENLRTLATSSGAVTLIEPDQAGMWEVHALAAGNHKAKTLDAAVAAAVAALLPVNTQEDSYAQSDD